MDNVWMPLVREACLCWKGNDCGFETATPQDSLKRMWCKQILYALTVFDFYFRFMVILF